MHSDNLSNTHTKTSFFLYDVGYKLTFSTGINKTKFSNHFSVPENNE